MWNSRQEELDQLSAVIDFLVAHVDGIALTRLEGQFPTSALLSGYRQAINDYVEKLSDAEPAYILQLDAAMRASGLPTFSQLRRHYSSRYRRILKRGLIKHEEEYYMTAAILQDTTLPTNDAEREKLSFMIKSYEEQWRSS